VLLGAGLGVNNLVNIDRIARAPVDKAKISAHLTLLGMLGGTAGALAAGSLADLIGLQQVFLLWLLPWTLAWLLRARITKHAHPAPSGSTQFATDAPVAPQGEATR
jgi:hypothetical protein